MSELVLLSSITLSQVDVLKRLNILINFGRMRFRDLDNVEVLLEIREIWHELATRKQV